MHIDAMNDVCISALHEIIMRNLQMSSTEQTNE